MAVCTSITAKKQPCRLNGGYKNTEYCHVHWRMHNPAPKPEPLLCEPATGADKMEPATRKLRARPAPKSNARKMKAAEDVARYQQYQEDANRWWADYHANTATAVQHKLAEASAQLESVMNQNARNIAQNQSFTITFAQNAKLATIPSAPFDETKSYDCKVCYDSFAFGDMIACTSACADKFEHLYCKPCVDGYIESGMGEGKAHTTCMLASSDKCGGCFTEKDVKLCVSAETFERYADQQAVDMARAMVLCVHNYQLCPFCEKWGIEANDSRASSVLCGRCTKSWCVKCRQDAHNGKCGYVANPDTVEPCKVQNMVTEIINAAVTKCCPTCKKAYVKDQGCNHMKCPCGVHSCFLCGEKICGYGHFYAGKTPYGGKTCALFNDYGLGGNLTDHGNGAFYKQKVDAALKELLEQNQNGRVREIICDTARKEGYADSVPKPRVKPDPRLGYILREPGLHARLIGPLEEQHPRLNRVLRFFGCQTMG